MWRACCYTVVLLLSALPLQGQGRPVEFGIDGGFSKNFDGAEESSFGFPAGYVRVGFYVSDRLEIEPLVTVHHSSEGAGETAYCPAVVSGGSYGICESKISQTFLALQPGITFHLSAFAPGQSRAYLTAAPALAYRRVAIATTAYTFDASGYLVGNPQKTTEESSGAQVGGSFGVGYKWSIATSGFMRFEASIGHLLKTDQFDSQTQLSLVVGLGGIIN